MDVNLFNANGSIELIIGPMFCGKTTELIRRAQTASVANKRVLLIKFILDDRYDKGDVITTHSKQKYSSTEGDDFLAPIKVISSLNLISQNTIDEVKKHDVICIDEGQFYSDLIEACERWAEEKKRIIISALDSDYLRRPFGQTCDLISKCELVTKLTGVCMICNKRAASFTKRIKQIDQLVVFSSTELYRSCCRTCYNLN